MGEYKEILTQPVFYLFVAFSFFLSAGYFWGRRRNSRIVLSAFDDLMNVFRPDDQNFTNIGGAIGYHANLYFKKKGFFLSRVDATITMLPRHSLLYFPVSKLIRKYDRLFLTMYLKNTPPEECHLIEKQYSGFAGTKIANRERLKKETVTWGQMTFYLYYETPEIRGRLVKFIERNPDPGVIRHIAVVPDQKKCFLFMIPRRGEVGKSLSPVARWLPSLVKND